MPLSAQSSRSGRAARSWAARRRLPVPTRAPCGRSLSAAAPQSASCTGARGGAPSRARPGASSAGTSLAECTARSISPASSACSIVSTQRDLSAAGVGGTAPAAGLSPAPGSSPLVRRITTSAPPSSRATWSACTRARLLPREPILIRACGWGGQSATCAPRPSGAAALHRRPASRALPGRRGRRARARAAGRRGCGARTGCAGAGWARAAAGWRPLWRSPRRGRGPAGKRSPSGRRSRPGSARTSASACSCSALTVGSASWWPSQRANRLISSSTISSACGTISARAPRLRAIAACRSSMS